MGQLDRLSSETNPQEMYQKLEVALKFIEDLSRQKNVLTNQMKTDDLNTPWPSKRHGELKTDEQDDKIENIKVDHHKDNDDDEDDDYKDDDDDDDDDDKKNSKLENLSKYLAALVGNFGNKILTKDGSIDWRHAKGLVSGLKTDLTSKFDEAGKVAKEDINIIINKFEELKKFVDADGVKENVKATKEAAAHLVKSLVGSIKKLKEASEEAADKSDWMKKFKYEAAKVKTKLETKWEEITEKWQKGFKDDDDDDDDDDEDEGYESDDSHKKQKNWRKVEDDDEGDDEDEEYEKKYGSRNDKDKRKNAERKYVEKSGYRS